MNPITRGIGLLLSLCIFTSCTSMTSKKDKDKKGNSIDAEVPKITKPIVKRIWIKDSINEDGTEYTTGHWKYILENKSVWSK